MFCSNTKGGFYVRHFKTNLNRRHTKSVLLVFFCCKKEVNDSKESYLRNTSAFVANVRFHLPYNL